MRRLLEKIRNHWKLRDKLLLSFLLLSSLAVLTVSSLIYLRSSKILIERAEDAMLKSLKQAQSSVNFHLNSARDISSMAYLDGELKRLIMEFKAAEDRKEKFDSYRRLQDKVHTLSMGRNIYGIRLYIDDKYIHLMGKNQIQSEDYIQDKNWYEEVLNEDGGVIWLPTYHYQTSTYESDSLISLVRVIPDDRSSGDHLGVLMVDIHERAFRDVIDQISIPDEAEIHLMDMHGYVITSNDQDKIGSFVRRSDYVPFESRYDNGKRDLKIDGLESILFHVRIPNMDWQLVSVMPISAVTQDAQEILQFMLILLLIVGVLSVLISFRLAGDITYRLEDLSYNMDKIKQDDWDIELDITYDDEIADLQRNFLYMTESMKRLINEKYQAEIDLRKAELRALQAQINPHFLYNILDMINWMAMRQGADDINYVVAKLAKFFRLSLSSGREMIPIGDELEHIRLYVDIQNVRYEDRIAFNMEIDESVLDYYTVNLILQPLVENAIMHGINERDDKKGIIRIVAYEDIESIIFKVEDNGVGMSEETLSSLQEGRSTGYGVRNVDERLKLRFGDEYGLTYVSKENEGTQVTVRIPIIDEVDEDEEIKN